jgi:hypothetical protein
VSSPHEWQHASINDGKYQQQKKKKKKKKRITKQEHQIYNS